MDQESTSSADSRDIQKDGEQKKVHDWKKHKIGIGCMTLFFLPFVIGGLASFFVSTYQFYKVYEAKQWTPVKGTILFVDLDATQSARGGAKYEIKLKYEYFIGAKSYTGNSLSFGIEKNNWEDYGTVYDKLNTANIVQIYVNENAPDESVIIRGVTNSMIVLAIFSIMLNALLMIFLLPMVFKKLTPRKVLVYTSIIWFLGITKLICHIGNIDISKKVIVIEAKEEYSI